MNNLRNSVQLIGNLGKDVEIKELESGRKLAKLTIATNEYYKNNKGETIKETQWHNLTAWGKTAELMAKVLTKGTEVMVNGKLMHRSYEDANGNVRYFSEVKVSEFLKLTKEAKEEAPF